MTALVWDAVGTRMYETGVDRGVLYLSDGRAVPWNGLTSVTKDFARETTPIYYDGAKIHEHVTLGEFAGSINAITYPSEFEILEGNLPINNGIAVGEQTPHRFALSYRTLLGTDLDGLDFYKIHVIYNVLVNPDAKQYASTNDSSDLLEFSWGVSTIPEILPIIPGASRLRPSSEIIIDSRRVDPTLLPLIEALLYGTDEADPAFPTMIELIEMALSNYRLGIFDLGDMTWEAVESDDAAGEFITVGGGGDFEITADTAIMISSDEYTISSVFDGIP